MTQKERIQSALVISHCPVPKIGWLSTVCRSTFLSLTERKGLVMANREPRIFNYHIETPWKPKRDASACPEIHCRPQWICRLRQGCFPPLCSGPGPFSCFFINQRRQVLPTISSRSRIRGWPGEPFSLFKYGLNHSSSTLPPTLHIAPLSGPLFSFYFSFPSISSQCAGPSPSPLVAFSRFQYLPASFKNPHSELVMPVILVLSKLATILERLDSQIFH